MAPLPLPLSCAARPTVICPGVPESRPGAAGGDSAAAGSWSHLHLLESASPSCRLHRFLDLGPPHPRIQFQRIRIKSEFSMMSFLRLLPQRLPRLFRQVEQDVETVIHVLQPGPIGIVEHKFTDVEILEARATVKRAVDNWQRNWTLERNLGSASFDKWKK
ncbi:hypothetical protein C2845_PM05G23450 [Panicum miliaceum]|uniref:Uncharacterized protein n=2 Tax=Panicum miliaceum TaxID=4540 RepID=A0A3L6T274_PANMI|nr:hypothetical protein C2845_PM05G23450 [Panicum miliaceum]